MKKFLAVVAAVAILPLGLTSVAKADFDVTICDGAFTVNLLEDGFGGPIVGTIDVDCTPTVLTMTFYADSPSILTEIAGTVQNFCPPSVEVTKKGNVKVGMLQKVTQFTKQMAITSAMLYFDIDGFAEEVCGAGHADIRNQAPPGPPTLGAWGAGFQFDNPEDTFAPSGAMFFPIPPNG